MKITITPDYLRHTEFTLYERLTLADFASARAGLSDKLGIIKRQRDQFIVSEADPRLVEGYNGRIAHIEWVIASIDHNVLEIYAEHGRLN